MLVLPKMAGLKLLFYRVDVSKCKQHLFIRTPNSGTVWWHSGTLMVERCGGTEEQSCWKSGIVMVEQWKSNGGTVEK